MPTHSHKKCLAPPPITLVVRSCFDPSKWPIRVPYRRTESDFCLFSFFLLPCYKPKYSFRNKSSKYLVCLIHFPCLQRRARTFLWSSGTQKRFDFRDIRIDGICRTCGGSVQRRKAIINTARFHCCLIFAIKSAVY